MSDARRADQCRSCRGRGRKTVRPRRLVVVGPSSGTSAVVRVVRCTACGGTGTAAAAQLLTRDPRDGGRRPGAWSRPDADRWNDDKANAASSVLLPAPVRAGVLRPPLRTGP